METQELNKQVNLYLEEHDVKVATKMPMPLEYPMTESFEAMGIKIKGRNYTNVEKSTKARKKRKNVKHRH